MAGIGSFITGAAETYNRGAEARRAEAAAKDQMRMKHILPMMAKGRTALAESRKKATRMRGFYDTLVQESGNAYGVDKIFPNYDHDTLMSTMSDADSRADLIAQIRAHTTDADYKGGRGKALIDQSLQTEAAGVDALGQELQSLEQTPSQPAPGPIGRVLGVGQGAEAGSPSPAPEASPASPASALSPMPEGQYTPPKPSADPIKADMHKLFERALASNVGEVFTFNDIGDIVSVDPSKLYAEQYSSPAMKEQAGRMIGRAREIGEGLMNDVNTQFPDNPWNYLNASQIATWSAIKAGLLTSPPASDRQGQIMWAETALKIAKLKELNGEPIDPQLVARAEGVIGTRDDEMIQAHMAAAEAEGFEEFSSFMSTLEKNSPEVYQRIIKDFQTSSKMEDIETALQGTDPTALLEDLKETSPLDAFFLELFIKQGSNG